MLCSQTRLLEIALNQIMFEERKCNGCLDYVQWQFFFFPSEACATFLTREVIWMGYETIKIIPNTQNIS